MPGSPFVSHEGVRPIEAVQEKAVAGRLAADLSVNSVLGAERVSRAMGAEWPVPSGLDPPAVFLWRREDVSRL